jgi:hypothetical protein
MEGGPVAVFLMTTTTAPRLEGTGTGRRSTKAFARSLGANPCGKSRPGVCQLGLVKGGDPEAGLAHAQHVIGELPPDQRIEVVLEVARSVAQAVPPAERQRPQATALRELLHASATRPGESVGPA